MGSILPLLTVVFLVVGKATTAMAATGSFHQIDKVCTSITPLCSPVLLPSMLCGRIGSMVQLPFISSHDGSTASFTTNITGVLHSRLAGEEALSPSVLLDSLPLFLRRRHLRRGYEARSCEIRRDGQSCQRFGDGSTRGLRASFLLPRRSMLELGEGAAGRDSILWSLIMHADMAMFPDRAERSPGLETLCGQAYGAGLYRMLGLYLRSSLIMSGAMSATVSVLWWFTVPVLLFLRQEPEVSRVAVAFIAVECYGVWRCARARSHDRTERPSAHPAEKARRSDPRKYKGCSKRGVNCVYRTQPCKKCRRQFCFFASDQLRGLPITQHHQQSRSRGAAECSSLARLLLPHPPLVIGRPPFLAATRG